jgi:chromosome segregation ATPase
MSDVNNLREQLAAIEHQRWADWQKWVHSLSPQNADGSRTIPAAMVETWERQIETPYAELSEAEKDSDREQVDRYWQLIGAFIAAERAASRSNSEISLQTQVQALKQKYEGVSVDIEKMRRLESDNNALNERVIWQKGELEEIADIVRSLRSTLNSHKAEIEDLEDGLVRSEGELYSTRQQLINAKAQLSFTTSKTTGYLNDLATLFHLLQQEAEVDMNAVPNSPPRPQSRDDDDEDEWGQG